MTPNRQYLGQPRPILFNLKCVGRTFRSTHESSHTKKKENIFNNCLIGVVFLAVSLFSGPSMHQHTPTTICPIAYCSASVRDVGRPATSCTVHGSSLCRPCCRLSYHRSSLFGHPTVISLVDCSVVTGHPANCCPASCILVLASLSPIIPS